MTNAKPSGRSQKAAARRETIVHAALDEFIERGFAAARMEDIASRAGVAKGTIYLHFKDKEALFEGIVRQEILLPPGSAAMDEIKPGEMVRAFIERTMVPLVRHAGQSRRAAVVRLVISEAPRFPGLAKAYYRVAIERGLNVFGGLARRARRTGELNGNALERFPQLFVAPVILGILWSGLFERFHHLDVEAMLRAHLDLIFGPAPKPKPSRSKRG
ncbi:MAG TPA: TetR/AcrR family transcriptional regulator [Bryobacteraceae bacterium]|nr:TetR/AcrR family transcriptional regulator [Bryobacteraceae bacterium]